MARDRTIVCATPAGSLSVRLARRFLSRALGLLVGPALGATEALLIAPCSSIHTVGMAYPIDVVFLDRDARVLRVCAAVRAGRMRFRFRAHAVLELASGAAQRQRLTPGTRLPELAAAMRA
jgi:uncharacterized protein